MWLIMTKVQQYNNNTDNLNKHVLLSKSLLVHVSQTATIEGLWVSMNLVRLFIY